MTTPWTGGCLCGAVRYELAEAPGYAEHCQCRDCQRSSGTGHSSSFAVAATALRLTGTLARYEKIADSGNVVFREFCPGCGSALLFRSAAVADLVFVSAGSLDEPDRFKPTAVLYTERAAAWDWMDPSLTRHPGMPPLD